MAFSWDILEPITACVSLSDAIAGYMFWIWSGRPWDLDSLRSFYYERELQKSKNVGLREEHKVLNDFKENIIEQLKETK